MTESEYGISGRRVDFSKGLPLAWGIEIDLPIGDDTRESVFQRSEVVIPNHITEIKFLDLSPQESLPIYLRNIRSDHQKYLETTLHFLVEPFTYCFGIYARDRVIGNLFKSVFNKNYRNVQKFNNALTTFPGNKIAIVEGHGSEDEWIIGEQYPNDPLEEKEKLLQKTGNDVVVEDVLSRYDDINNFAGILLITCNPGSKLKSIQVPVAYAKKEVDYVQEWIWKKPNTQLVMPRNWR